MRLMIILFVFLISTGCTEDNKSSPVYDSLYSRSTDIQKQQGPLTPPKIIDPTSPIKEAINSGDLETVKKIVSSGYVFSEMYYNSELYYSLHEKQFDIFKWLLLNIPDVKGYAWDPLEGGLSMDVVHSKNIDLINAVAEIGIDFNGPTEWTTPLIEAVEMGSIEIVTALLKNGAIANQQHCFGPYNYASPIISACVKGRIDIIELLIANGADFAPLSSGYSPLMVAVYNNQYNTVKFLLAHGVDPSLVNEDGTTALDIAKEQNFPEIINLLSKK